MRPVSPSSELRATLRTESAVARARYFEAVHCAALNALARGADITRHIRVGRDIVRLQFSNQLLADEMMPALAHLDLGAAPSCSLSISICETQSSGVQVPSPPWTPEAYVSRGDIRGWDGDVWAAYHLGTGQLSLYDVTRCEAVHWVRDPGTLPEYERAAPLRTILGWFARSRGAELVHAAAVGRPTGGVLLAGRSGRGKSTTALSCIAGTGNERSIRYAGDDYVMVTCDPSPRVYSIYNSGKLDRDHARARLAELLPLVTNANAPQGVKGLVFAQQGFPDRVILDFPLRAVMVPEIEPRPGPALRPISPRLVLQELAPSTMSQMPGTGASTLAVLTALVKAIPCYGLALGNGRSAPELIARFLDEP